MTNATSNHVNAAPTVEMSPVFRLRLTFKVSKTVIDAMAECMEHAVETRSPSAISYAKNMEKSFDLYGLDGLQMQALYLVCNLGAWHGPEARKAKRVVRDWSISK